MHSSALDMYIEDAPVLELSSTDKTLFKEVVDGTLFKEVKFYSSWDEVNHIMGYVFHKSYKDGTKFVNHLERAKLWAARCDYISTWTCELRQHLYDRWYAIGHSEFFHCNLIKFHLE